MKNLTAYQLARIRLAKANTQKLSNTEPETAATDQRSDPVESEKSSESPPSDT